MSPTRYIKNYISYKHIYIIRDKYYKFEIQKLKSSHFSNAFVINDLRSVFYTPNSINCLGGVVVSVLDSYYGSRVDFSC